MYLVAGVLAALTRPASSGRGPGRRRRDHRRRRAPLGDDLGDARRGPLEHRARHQPARLGRAVLRRVRDVRRPVDVGRALEPQFYDELIGGARRSTTCRIATTRVSGRALRKVLAETFATRTQAEWRRCSTAPTRASRRSYRTSRRTPAQRRPRHVRRARRRRAARAGTALLPDPRRPDDTTARPGANTAEALAAWGITDVDQLLADGVAVQAR